MVQSLLPNRRGTGSGLALGFMFFSGAVGSYFLGLIADRVGLDVALQGTAVLPLIALPGRAPLAQTKLVNKTTLA
jgi:hypothetical protein